MRAGLALVAVLFLLALSGCGAPPHEHRVLRVSASSVGNERELLERQLQRFSRAHPDVRVVLEETPDSADQRHQLYVQWLSSGVGHPDVLQLDVVWTPEFAGAGWLTQLDGYGPESADFFAGPLAAHRHEDRLYALPWFVDVGMLYYRSDLLAKAPGDLDELGELARTASQRYGLDTGLAWQQARYEGLVTVFVEVLGAFGGSILDERGDVTVDSAAAEHAVGFMRDLLESGAVPREALGWQEEQTRFAFQNGHALFMRNWPYAFALMQKSSSKVRDKFRVTTMPGTASGAPTAALGGAGLAINAFSSQKADAYRLIEYLTAPDQMAERAIALGQLPARPAVFAFPEVAEALEAPSGTLVDIITHAKPRPPHPMYAELSSLLQVNLHRALTGQVPVRDALADAANEMRDLLRERGPRRGVVQREPLLSKTTTASCLGICVLLALLFAFWRARSGRETVHATGEVALGWRMAAPAVLVLVLVALVPLGLTVTESLYVTDLRAPWQPMIGPGLANYREILGEPGLWGAFLRTLLFTLVSVLLELALGLALALALQGRARTLSLARVAALIPWAVPTVVAGLLWRFLFDGRESFANTVLTSTGLLSDPLAWLSGEWSAWLPIVAADVWKTTPFVTLLLLAGLSTIDQRLYEAARVDGAYRWQQFRHVTLPLLRPTLLVVLLFRALDALRVFDLIYVLTQGGPGTKTEPISMFAFTKLFTHLRVGEGAAVSVLIFLASAALAFVFVRALSREEAE